MNKTFSATALLLALGSSLAFVTTAHAEHAGHDMKMDKKASMEKDMKMDNHMAENMKEDMHMEMNKDKKMDDNMMKADKHGDNM